MLPMNECRRSGPRAHAPPTKAYLSVHLLRSIMITSPDAGYVSFRRPRQVCCSNQTYFRRGVGQVVYGRYHGLDLMSFEGLSDTLHVCEVDWDNWQSDLFLELRVSLKICIRHRSLEREQSFCSHIATQDNCLVLLLRHQNICNGTAETRSPTCYRDSDHYLFDSK